MSSTARSWKPRLGRWDPIGRSPSRSKKPTDGRRIGKTPRRASMTTQAENDFLTKTGPGTPMGELFRRYWLPAMHADEIPEPDCPPVRVTLLSEKLVAFRDTRGRIGMIEEFCAHRGASLWFGRNEESGLRCPYHGWKYDVTGQCVEVPSEPVESGYCGKI